MPSDQSSITDRLLLSLDLNSNSAVGSPSYDVEVPFDIHHRQIQCCTSKLIIAGSICRMSRRLHSDPLAGNCHQSGMSPNPEKIDFLNDIQREYPSDDEADGDSGFCTGGSFSSYKMFSSHQDHEILMGNANELSICGFYFPDLDSMGAMKMLKKSTIGTFLIRNSLDAQHLFSLSVKTHRGATSVRVLYHKGWFLFDCDERIRKRMPKFRSVLSLVDHHVELSKQGVNNSWRWEEKSGKKNMVVDISKPCRTSAPSLKHLCTIAVNRSKDILRLQSLQRSPHDFEKLLECTSSYPFKI